MRQPPLLSNPDAWPRPGSAERATLGRTHWLEQAARASDAGVKAFARAFAETAGGRKVLDAIFGNSPYLGDCLLKEVAFFQALLAEDPKIVAERLLRQLREEASSSRDTNGLKHLLRVAKRRNALLVAFADIAGLWTAEEVMDRLSAFADTALELAVDHLLRGAIEEGQIEGVAPEQPAKRSGFVLLALGKLGAYELNYSSDVDLVVLYDPERLTYRGEQDIQRFFERLTRSLVTLIEERTPDGYVFRTDLRLRPDPGATPIAMSVAAAEAYYESAGQNWERAAFIKARSVAGDLEAGEAFLKHLQPFLWRKFLDFASIQDIHSIKRQIETHRGGHTIGFAGHNVKLGRGGIREIELFTQTQQLIWGGRMPELRVEKTCEALSALAKAGRIATRVATDLIESYRYLRRVEHRLQMIEDKQIHKLPEEPERLVEVAVFLGYANADAFKTELHTHLNRVVRHSSALFQESPVLGAEEGKLVFTGGENDPDTVETLEKIGFQDASNVASVVRGWHHGRYRATRAERARQILTELMPALLKALAGTVNPTAAFMKFDEFLSQLPAGVQLFSLFQANPALLDLVAEIMGSAPSLAENLSRHSILLDSVLGADFFAPPLNKKAMAEELRLTLNQARDFQDVLDLSRRWTNDWKFRIGVQVLRNLLPSDKAGGPLSDVAETVVAALFAYVEKDFMARHGHFAGGGMAVIAMGKLGGRELTFQSDLDLVYVYDVPEGTERSDGPRPLSASHYFARLGQALNSALTSMTGEGNLYEVDMRLRPTGNAGPFATSLASYRVYFQGAAWTWEYQALTRARTIAGPTALRKTTENAITEALHRPMEAATLLRDIAEMRTRIATARPGTHFWDIKNRPGGLIDVEFLCQYLVLTHLAKHPEIRDTNTLQSLERLRKAKLVEAEAAETLTAAARFWQRLLGLLRLSFNQAFEEHDMPEGLRHALLRATECKNFAELKTQIETTAENVRRLFTEWVAAPASQLPPKEEKGSTHAT